MPALVRSSDTNLGTVREHCGHGEPFHVITGVQGEGSPSVTCNGLAVIRVGDRGLTDCPDWPCLRPDCPYFTDLAGSPSVTCNGLAVVRVGDAVDYHGQGTGEAVSGSPSVSVN